MDEKQIFSEILKKYMVRDGISQAEIAKVAGVAQSTVSEWLKAKKMPRMPKVQKLSIYFGLNISDLVDEEIGEMAIILSQDEIRLINAYRLLSPTLKEYILFSVTNAADFNGILDEIGEIEKKYKPLSTQSGHGKTSA
jgi:transcriptional regulator with XRE-family HTH domain